MVDGHQQDQPQTVDTLATSQNLISIKVECHNQLIDAVIDTGSTRNIVSKEFAHSVSLPKIEGETVLLKIANNSLVNPDGKTEIEVKIQEQVLNVEALVVNNFPYQLLLGLQFCEQSGLIIDFNSKNVNVCGTNYFLPPKFYNHPIQPVRNLKDINIQPNSEICLPVSIKTSANCQNLWNQIKLSLHGLD